MSAADVYTKEVHSQLQRYATWLPTDKVAVGMVGQLLGKKFVPLSHLTKFGISARIVRDPDTNATYKFMSSGTNEVAIGASASGVPTAVGVGAAKLNIVFSKANAVYFCLDGCGGAAIEDLADLGGKILKQVEDHRWPLDYVVVTRVVTAQSATILQAQTRGASIELEGDAPGIPVANLLKAGVSVKVKSQSSISLSIVAQSKLTPLFGLARVKYTFYDRLRGSGPKFSYTLARNTIGLTPFTAHVEATPNIDFKGSVKTKNDLQLNVKLPKFGDYVDIANLLDLTGKISVVRPTPPQKVRIATPESFGLCARIHGDRLAEIVKKLPNVELDTEATTDDFINLNLTLPKSGSNICAEPLVKLALGAAAPKAQAKMSAELTFGEIP